MSSNTDALPSEKQPKRSLHVSDIGAQRSEVYFRPPEPLRSFLVRLIKDGRDEPILFMLFNVLCTTVPAACIVFYARSHVLGLAYWLCNTLLYHERFILGLHFYAHRGLFRSRVLDTVLAWALSPFFGLPSCMYWLHHVIMHHAENNRGGWDLSSTERFQRDNVFHFLCYWARFAGLVWVELPLYAFRRERYALAAGVACAVCAFFAVTVALCQANPVGTFWVVVFPTFANSFMLMFGNWAQHMFIDPAKPRCNYHLAYNVINDGCNQRSFNDGYHIEHHVNSRRHWTELPHSFVENIDKYAAEDAIVFQGLDNFKVGALVFMQRYDVLARHIVQFRFPMRRKRSPAEIEQFLRARLVPIAAE